MLFCWLNTYGKQWLQSFPQKVMTQVSWNLMAGVALMVFERTLFEGISYKKGRGGGWNFGLECSLFILLQQRQKPSLVQGHPFSSGFFLMVVQWTKTKYTSPSPGLLSIPGTHGYIWPASMNTTHSSREHPQFSRTFCFCHLEDNRTSFRRFM